MAGSQQEHSDVALHGTWPSHTFLALATQIHQTTGFTITIATTPININYLRSTIITNHQSHDQICLVALPFNSSDHDLPPITENTEAVPLNQLTTLFQASTVLEAPSYQLLADHCQRRSASNLHNSDVLNSWATCVAQSIQTVNVSFTTCVAQSIQTVNVSFTTSSAHSSVAYISL
ncbi:unnamed protein product [Camellia sinensis]